MRRVLLLFPSLSGDARAPQRGHTGQRDVRDVLVLLVVVVLVAVRPHAYPNNAIQMAARELLASATAECTLLQSTALRAVHQPGIAEPLGPRIRAHHNALQRGREDLKFKALSSAH